MSFPGEAGVLSPFKSVTAVMTGSSMAVTTTVPADAATLAHFRPAESQRIAPTLTAYAPDVEYVCVAVLVRFLSAGDGEGG